MKALIPTASILLLATTVAQTDQKPVLTSKDLTVWAKSWSSEGLGDNRFRFTAKGSPVTAIAQGEGKTLKANSIVGEIVRAQGGKLYLDNATLSGEMYAKQIKASESGDKDALQTTELTAASANYTRDGEKWTLHNGVKVYQTDPAVARVVDIKGKEGTVFLFGVDKPKKTRFPVKSGNLSGGVTFTIKGRYRETDEKTKQAKWVNYTTTGNADRLELLESEGTLTLIGNVNVNGDAPVFMGDMSGSKITITFNADGKPIRVEGDAEDRPGTTIIGRKPPVRRTA